MTWPRSRAEFPTEGVVEPILGALALRRTPLNPPVLDNAGLTFRFRFLKIPKGNERRRGRCEIASSRSWHYPIGRVAASDDLPCPSPGERMSAGLLAPAAIRAVYLLS